MRQQERLQPWLAGFTAMGLMVLLGGAARADEPRIPTIEFNRDIRPILANSCFACHGPDNNLRKADLRLDRSEDALADRGGYHVLVPGKAAASELYKRITSDEPAKRMPPRKSNRTLTKGQIELLREWIAQGAQYQPHWSLLAAKRRPVPAVKNASWPRNPIDNFILARLEQEGLQPSPEADRRTLARRLSFDLRGLPPTPEEVEAFVQDASPKAYDRYVGRMLTSPHHGERLAVYWLDVVRFADTGGYHSDNHRDVALYRDWVINAFNDNLPFDRFTVEQLAGDLLPKATNQQKIASGFNRLLQTTEEGGAQAKEYTAKYAADRVRNTGTIFLGLTLGCCECHNHKFDPVTTKEFYSFAAFFADVQERAVGRQDQTPFPSTTQETQLKQLDAVIASVQQQLARPLPGLDAAVAKWEEALRSKGAKAPKLPKDVADVLKIEPGKRDAKQKEVLAAWYSGNVAPELQGPRQKLAELQKQRAEATKTMLTSLVSMSGPPRTVRLLRRGNWLDDAGEVVVPGVPASLPPLDVKDRRATRLDLARWMVAPENPLLARVFVNRMWLLFYGEGIVKTQYDFGAQGAWPTHPELLDWLAVEFRESGWDMRHLIRLLVTSSAYRQSSRPSELLRHRDPYNTLLARQARFRLDAEFVRDNALAISGLLSHKVGGPSVKPYQPAGYWRYLNFPTREWQADKGENQYRRGLYTYWQRTFLHPSLLAFDAPTREECTAERTRSNTPQQALVLLNDPTYVEAARTLAERMMREGGKGIEDRIHFAYRQALARRAEPAELQVLRGVFERHQREYQGDTKAAEALLHAGYRPTPSDLAAPELAAWTSVARVILNLHETITRD